MKTRIMVYLCLLVLLGAGIMYVTRKTQVPTGLAGGIRINDRNLDFLQQGHVAQFVLYSAILI